LHPKQTEELIMISMKFKEPFDTEPSSICECDDCDASVELWEALPIKNPQKVIHMADVVPAGQCPECGDGFLYLLEA